MSSFATNLQHCAKPTNSAHCVAGLIQVAWDQRALCCGRPYSSVSTLPSPAKESLQLRHYNIPRSHSFKAFFPTQSSHGDYHTVVFKGGSVVWRLYCALLAGIKPAIFGLLTTALNRVACLRRFPLKLDATQV